MATCHVDGVLQGRKEFYVDVPLVLKWVFQARGSVRGGIHIFFSSGSFFLYGSLVRNEMAFRHHIIIMWVYLLRLNWLFQARESHLRFRPHSFFIIHYDR